ncbi:MAG: hypothetical protein CSA21_00850 [Deltaproteobacteria bacterium]|nr:MAG: hypothetical protein CSA21_00850 [Deltaproteobacteria bacterium]
MRFDSRWNSKSRPVFRMVAFLLSLVSIPMGILALVEKFGSDPIEFDSTFKFGIAALGWGIIFLIIAIRGRIFKKNF